MEPDVNEALDNLVTLSYELEITNGNFDPAVSEMLYRMERMVNWMNDMDFVPSDTGLAVRSCPEGYCQDDVYSYIEKNQILINRLVPVLEFTEWLKTVNYVEQCDAFESVYEIT